MGREVRRVPVTFDHPIGQTWPGYLMPDRLREDDCRDCRGLDGFSDGLTVAARAIADTFYAHQIGGYHADSLAWHDKIGQAEVDNLLAEGRLKTLVERTPTDDNPRTREWVSLPLTAAEVNARQKNMLDSHDGINRMILIQFRCQQLGIDMECPTCKGYSSVESYPGQRAEAEAWEPTPPPTGDGWQLWETTSEGSPVSPVFRTGEELARWLTTAEGGHASGPSRKPMTISSARAFVGDGWAPTGVATAGGYHDGAHYIGTEGVLRQIEEPDDE